MKKYILTICALLALSASASAVTVDFNSAIGSPDGYVDQGITFSYTGVGTNYFSNNGPVLPSPSGSNALTMTGGDNTSFWTADLGGSLANSISVDLGDNAADADRVFLSIFDSADNLINTLTQDLASDFVGMMTLALSGYNIAYATFGTTGDLGAGGIYADNFTVSAVPVPAAAWLFGSALLGFFGFSRKKAKA